MSMLFCCVIF